MEHSPNQHIIYQPVSTEAPKLTKETDEFLIESTQQTSASSSAKRKLECGHYKECCTVCCNFIIMQFYNL